jgi:transposase-like protein
VKKTYSEEFKKDIVNQCLAGTSVAAISKNMELPEVLFTFG